MNRAETKSKQEHVTGRRRTVDGTQYIVQTTSAEQTKVDFPRRANIK